MKTTKMLTIFVLALILIVWSAAVSEAEPMGTAWTYQGRLIDANSAADGRYDFQFKLYYGPADPNQVGGTADVNDLDVIDGYFTAELNFGSSVFDGNSVWLQIDVRPGDSNDPNAFVTLSPRQEITPTPYALQTRGIFVDKVMNVGIGTTSPDGKLHIDGGKAKPGIWGTDITIKAQDGGDGGGFMGDDGGNGGDIILLPGEGGEPSGLGRRGRDGKVGIGTTKPSYDLDVVGNINFSGNLYQDGSLFSGGGSLWTASGSDIYFDAGNVGIGTDSPLSKLHVISSDSTAIYGYSSGENNYSGFFGGGRGLCVSGMDEMGGHLSFLGLGSNPITDAWGTIEFKDIYNNLKGSITSRSTLIGHVLWLGAGEDVQMCIYNNNRVGIGTFLPVGQLTLGEYQGGTVGSAVAGHEKQLVLGGEYNTWYNTGSSVKLLISDYDNDAGTDIYPIYCEDEQNKVDFYVRKQEGDVSTAYFGGKVGIGTMDPVDKLHVKSRIRIEGSDTSYPFLDLVNGAGTGRWTLYGNNDDEFHIAEYVGTLRGVRFMIKEGGNVGIGTTSPGAKLDVAGRIRVSDMDGDPIVEIGEGLDYAEGFNVTEEADIEAGTVLVIDSENPGKLTVSRSAYDSKVAGIVAGGKGLGSGVRLGVSQFDQDVALAGRVYCKVDTTDAPVQPGDLLTTSATAGYAMKATDYDRARGAILGKAMEKLEQGQKEQILVLVTLQ